ncbi:hypothetical protein CONLIGDRAFT_686541 [Coniochaeta ligniaria NRRL 30616]|uniref:Uncharacterized protein n=1 Tax=Coniochaeta ligniaria NRRL 30616 TaxID=1408157 RepID=A0A1J7I7I8_9PEZI|nr:hypothetical protein CONLIGDRAFT_686541 [Coniochaeta ligniaria NRRL 30616]
MASKHRILIPPAWPSRLADPSAIDLKTATPPAISSQEYVSKLDATLSLEETAKLKELDPNDTRSETRLPARSSSPPASPVGLVKDRENSTKHSSSSSDVPPEKIQSSRIQNRVCLDPQMHPNQSHSEVHHPGLLPLGDFCDFGVEAAPEVQTETPQKALLDRFRHDLAADDDKDQPQTLQSNPPVHPQGRVFRALTGGDICVEPVEVSGHFHAGHPPILKVRPAHGVALTPQQPPHLGHRNPVSKVGPFVKDNSQFPPVEESNPDVKHQPSNYWGFSTKDDKLGEVPLDKDEPLFTGVISPPKPTDEYGPPGLGDQDTARSLGDKATAPSGDEATQVSEREVVGSTHQDDYLHCLSEDHIGEGIHGSLEPTQAPKSEDPDPESWIQKRTSRWLKDLLHHPNTYSSKLTELPGKIAGRRNTFSSPGEVLWDHQKDLSTSRPLTRHSVDYHYKTAFNDLEKILDNAVQLAKAAVEQFELKPTKGSGRDGDIIVPVPQRISSLLRLGVALDKQNTRTSLGDRVDKSKHVPMSSPDRGIRPEKPSSIPDNHCTDAERWSLDGTPSDVVDFSTQYNLVRAAANDNKTGPSRRLVHTHTAPLGAQDIELQELDITAPAPQRPGVLNLRGRSHVSLRGGQGFSLARSHPRQPVARDWSDARKRYVASVACISTALIGVLVGIYAGLVPSIQYYIVDLNHYAILGNVVFYFGLAIPSFFFWPLPLLHGRKPYILSSLVIAMPLLFPQAISVSQMRSPYISQWR